SDLKPGRVKVIYSFIGYVAITSDTLFLNPASPEMMLGQIKLYTSVKQLAQATVNADRGMLQMAIDKKVFNVEKNVLSTGGSANDVLQTIPSINVDLEGNLSLRGSGNITVLIDGRPSTLTGTDRNAVLEQIPSSAIESVELITNPSAKYDPDGTSGIINIILKKNKQTSLNGSINSSVTYGAGRYSLGYNLNYKNKKWNLSTGYSVRANQMNMRSYNTRKNYNTDTTFTNQDGLNHNQNTTNVLRFSADHYINSRSTIGLTTTLSKTDKSSNGSSANVNFNETHLQTDALKRLNIGVENSLNVDLGLNYRKSFLKPKEELSIDLSYSNNASNAQTDYETSNTFNPNLFIQNAITKSSVNLSSFKLDYVNPINEQSKLETGYKLNFRSNDADFNVADNSQNPDTLIPNTLQSNHFIYTEIINAAYVNYGRTIGGWGVQGGLRMEHANIITDQVTAGIKNRQPYLSFFPSLYFARKLGADQEVQLNYSRRINRPQVNNLNPFTDFSDPRNLRTGNPNLKPEYVDAYELSYIKYWKKNTLTSTLYFRQTNDQIQRYRLVDTAGISTVTFQNLSFSRNFGFEFIAVTELMKFWTLTTNLNLFRNEIAISSTNAELKTGSNGSVKIMSTTKLPNILDIQISGNYTSAGVTAQGEFKEMYSFDIGLKKAGKAKAIDVQY
ncbi:MAG: TonB-dependent receptor domain-containing protein, partial [Sphingobacteriaceae bacterium]